VSDLAPPAPVEGPGPWRYDARTRRFVRKTIGEQLFDALEPEPPPPVRCHCHRLAPACWRCDGAGFLLS
jgi:hypothetical protein